MSDREEWLLCCPCCDEGAKPGFCVFNGTRDQHSLPCPECDRVCPCCGDVHRPVAPTQGDAS